MKTVYAVIMYKGKLTTTYDCHDCEWYNYEAADIIQYDSAPKIIWHQINDMPLITTKMPFQESLVYQRSVLSRITNVNVITQTWLICLPFLWCMPAGP